MAYENVKVQYLINQLSTGLGIGGQWNIVKGGYIKVTSSDLKQQPIISALENGYVKLVNNKPEDAETQSPAITITSPYKGLTAEELNASKAEDAKVETPPAATGVSIGAVSEDTPSPAAKGYPIGVPEEASAEKSTKPKKVK